MKFRSRIVTMFSVTALCVCHATEGNWLQYEIDKAAASGGGVVSVEPGEREFKQIVLKSGVTFRLEKGPSFLPAPMSLITQYATEAPC